MTPNMKAFSDEYALVKTGKKAPLSKEEWVRLGKNVGAFTAGSAVGGGLGYVARKKLLPKLLPHLGPKQRTALALGGGAATGILSTLALKHHMRTMNDSIKRND